METPVWLAMMLGRRAAPDGRFEAALGIQPLPAGRDRGAARRDGNRWIISCRSKWHAAGPERREAIAAFIADQHGRPECAGSADNQTLMTPRTRMR